MQLRHGHPAGSQRLLRRDARWAGQFLWGGPGGLPAGDLRPFGIGFFSSGSQDAIAFLLLLLILYIRPRGLSGSAPGALHDGPVSEPRSRWSAFLGLWRSPGRLQSYYLQLLNVIGIYTLLTLGLNMLMGYAGQISLGHAAFYGLGAYTSAILTTHFHVSPWLALPLALLLSAGVAFLVGIPTLKLSGYYLGMGTLGFGMIIHVLFRDGAA